VVDIVLGDGQLILSVLHLCTGIIKEVRVDVMAVVHPHQLIILCLDLRLKTMVLLEELSVAHVLVLDGAVLLLHLVVILLQAHTLEGASRRGLLKQ
jgi:hypothetical protein